ncbi:MAG: hypothetical protein AUG51_23415 [Acidobacteria bacterium 13_1_20CM_3_53_8]|nr:MAG: hypothetical protein AUG51_23415 [Acidobacteria bacterium 13_1_20CM_3_53_8]
MLIIRPEQMEVFKPQADAQFAERVAAYLRRKHADVVVRLVGGATLVNRLSDETLMKMVRLGIERALSYDFTWESSITAFIVLMFKVAPNFDQHPLIARALKDARFAPEERVEKIWERVTSKNWEAAREDYDPRAWQLKPEER